MINWYQKDSPVSPLMQGDIVFNCPRIVVPSDLTLKDIDAGDFAVDIKYTNSIVVTQSCDINSKGVSEVLLCPFYPFGSWIENLEEYQYNAVKGNKTKNIVEKSYEALRKGQYTSLHLLNKDNSINFNDYQVVALNKPYALSTSLISNMVHQQGYTIRLNSPYREHLSQAYARLFMRVGLPSDIPNTLTPYESYLPSQSFIERVKPLVKKREEDAEARRKDGASQSNI